MLKSRIRPAKFPNCRISADTMVRSKAVAWALASLVLAALVCPAFGEERLSATDSVLQQLSGGAAVSSPDIYVPYEHLAQLIDPADKAMLMDRAEFEKLLAAAEENAGEADTLELGQIILADYAGVVTGEKLELTGELQVLSMSERPIAVRLGFAKLGLRKLLLDGKAAPLGYDRKGRLSVILTRKGTHLLKIEGAAKLKELSTGGMHFSIAMPAAVAGKMTLTAGGDLDIHATVPKSKPTYDKQNDRTSVELTIGGHHELTVVLLGNGRREDDRPILLDESACTVRITRSHQVLNSLHTIQVLRRGARQLQFQLPAEWTVTDVTCPGLVRWSIQAPQQPNGPQMLIVRIRSPKVGTTALHISAAAASTGWSWSAPRINLVGAVFERGYVMAEPDEGLRVRGQTLANARRQDAAVVAVPGIASTTAGQLYFHWGQNWSVQLALAGAELRRSIEEKQNLRVTPELVTLTGNFEVTAIERELFDISFVIAAQDKKWHISTIKVNNSDTGFEYRVEDKPDHRVLRIELARPVLPEQLANVEIVMQHVPQDWYWPSDAAERTITVPVIQSRAENVSGYLSVFAQGDLDAVPAKLPQQLQVVPVGRMSTLGLPERVQYAYSYKQPAKGEVQLKVSRRRPRFAADSIGLIDVRPQGLSSRFRITYTISRASAKKLYLLADKSLEQNISITSATVPISSRNIVAEQDRTFPLPAELLQRYNLWMLSLDSLRLGKVPIDISYDRPLPQGRFSVPLVRPICPAESETTANAARQNRGRINELVAIQASVQLALTINTDGAKPVDAIDLPPLPTRAARILAAFRFESATAPGGSQAAMNVATAVHENYAIPSALAVSAELTTYLDPQGWQRTQAILRVANAGRQFLTFRLPQGARLWSLRVADKQAKPQRDAQGDYQVPLRHSTEPIPVRVVYGSQPNDADFERLELGTIELPGIEINNVRWSVIPPPGFEITAQHTKMRACNLPRPTPAYIQVYNFVTQNMFKGSLWTAMPFLSPAGVRELSQRTVTGSNLRSIGNAIMVYRNDSKGQWPDSLDQLVEHDYINAKQLYDARGNRIQYFRPPPGDVAGDQVIAVASAENGRHNVLFADTRVQAGLGLDGGRGDKIDRARVVADIKFAGGAHRRGGVQAVEQAAPAATPAQPGKIPLLGDLPSVGGLFKSEGTAFGLTATGRFTLPVELVPTAGAGPTAVFTGMGRAQLIVGLSKQSRRTGSWIVGFALAVSLGVLSALKKARVKAMIFVAVLAVASVMAIWSPAVTHFANGVFFGGLCLAPLYVLICLLKWLWPRLRLGPLVGAKTAPALTLLVIVLLIAGQASTAQAARRVRTRVELPPSVIEQVLKDEELSALPPLIFPYEGDPTAAEKPQKVLIPYSRFVKLWNQAHPDDTIDGLEPGTDISLADVHYTAALDKKQLKLLLTTDVQTYGKDWVSLALPVKGLAVTEITLDGKPARWQGVPGASRVTSDERSAIKVTHSQAGIVLMLQGGISGKLKLSAIATPTYFGRRGTIDFSLPPLPAALMDITLPEEDLELEVDGLDALPTKNKANGKVSWTIPLGITRKLTLRWLPGLGVAAADRTLSAACEHNIYAFHWAAVGVSKINYTFSAGEHERFGFYLPADATLTELEGANIRDHRQVAQKTIDGSLFKLIEARLYRPATKRYGLTVRWLTSLPALDDPARLLLVRAADVARESGTVTLHAAGGMQLKVADVTGGRRAAAGSDAVEPEAAKTRPVAKYYWPYRPFSLSIKLSRLAVSPKASLDQLVRISTDRVQLLIQAALKTDQGRLFGTNFALPAGYELLSVVGPDVENFYESSIQDTNLVNVKFSSAVRETQMALVLVSKDVQLEDFRVPMVTAVDSRSTALPEQTGRVAIQVAASLDARTLAVTNLKSVIPRSLRDWLDGNQVKAVQFAYSYQQSQPSLTLGISPRPTRLDVECFAGLVVRTTAAAYTYRLRYDIDGSPVDHLKFSMPSEYASLVAVVSPAMRSVTQSAKDTGRTTWDIALANEVTGTVDVAVNFTLPIDETTTQLKLPRIETDAPKTYHAILAVQNISRHKISVQDQNTLEELAPSRQRQLIPPQVRQSLQYVFQSFTQDWSLALDFTAAEPAARIQAVVDLVAVTTVIDRSGQCRYEVRIALQNRSEQFLRVKVPEALRLWSATVAGQPVKPVKPAESSQGEIWIPLVKTSPGGLPYDVFLYLADQADKPLLKPLDGITRLTPPAISIVKMPVTQTIWSLRLPEGYKYIRPGGNMSPVVGTVEMLSLNIQARLDQLKRLDESYREVADSSEPKGQIAAGNWRAFNKKLSQEISSAQRYLEANSDQIRKEDFERLQAKFNKQQVLQSTIITGNTAFVRQQQEQVTNNMNVYLNLSSGNAGVVEVLRNSFLEEKPQFVGRNEEQQMDRLRRQLEDAEKQQQTFQAQAGEPIISKYSLDAKTPTSYEFGRTVTAEDLITRDEASKEAEMKGLMRKLSEQSAAQIERQEQQLKFQMSNIADNRAQRLFRQKGQLRPPGPGRAKRRTTAGGQLDMAYGGGIGTTREELISQAEMDKAEMSVTVTYSDVGAEEDREELTLGTSEMAAEGESIQPYVAGGTYSLPVSLPGGGIRLDFARPSGQPRLSVLAVPVTMIQKCCGAAIVLVVLLALLAVIKIWPKTTRRAPLSTKLIILYIVLLAALTILLGLLGLFISILAILISQAARSSAARTSTVSANK